MTSRRQFPKCDHSYQASWEASDGSAEPLPNMGALQLPFGFGLAPVLEYRSGFPYSVVDVLQQYVGIPNSRRFPTSLLSMRAYGGISRRVRNTRCVCRSVRST